MVAFEWYMIVWGKKGGTLSFHAIEDPLACHMIFGLSAMGIPTPQPDFLDDF